MRDGYLRGAPSRPATRRQVDVLAAYVAAGGSVPDAATLLGTQPSTAKRHLADLRARTGLTTKQLIERWAGRGLARHPEPRASVSVSRPARPLVRALRLEYLTDRC